MPRTMTVAGRLTAAEGRTLRGLLLPFGSPGRTNRGRVVARAGSVRVPADVSGLHATLDHLDERDSVATFVSVTETPAGLLAEWSVPATHGGDRLLAEYGAGTRTGISVELEPYAVVDGVLTAGELVGCAFPERPAFDDARLMAEDSPEDDDPADDEDDDDLSDDDAQADSAGDDGDDDDTTDPAPTDPPEDPAVPTSTRPAAAAAAGAPATAGTGMHAARPRRGGRLTAEAVQAPADLFRLLAAAHRDRDTRLLAALADITSSAHSLNIAPPQWVGELWSGIPYTRRVVPLVNTADLTAYTVAGWRWVTRPVVAPYAGDKAPVPSNTPTTEPVNIEAERLAGAHDVDRKYRDFGDTAFFDSYYRAMTESYAKLSDAALVADLKAAATPVTAGRLPADLPASLGRIVDGALAIVDEGDPSFALVGKTVYRDAMMVPADKRMAYFDAALGISRDGGTVDRLRVVPCPGLGATEVIVGARQAATFHELPGVPIRAEAVDMVKGGIDVGVFGYYATNVHDDRVLVSVAPAPTA